MCPNQTPFPAAWLSIEIKGYREQPQLLRTYHSFSFENLPPLPSELFGGDFEWLKKSELQPFDVEETADLNSQIERLSASAAKLQLRLPNEFTRFMKSPDLPHRIRSCTGCFFELPEEIIESPAGANGYLIRFLSDSQGCLFWYLYLNGVGESCVVASYELFGSKADFELFGKEENDAGDESDIFFCAASFEAFMRL